MINRALFDVAFSEEWGRQMRFITGPRQCGKTTLAKKKLEAEKMFEMEIKLFFHHLWWVKHWREEI